MFCVLLMLYKDITVRFITEHFNLNILLLCGFLKGDKYKTQISNF